MLDVIMTKRANMIINTVNIEDLVSDHQAVMTIRKMKITPADESYFRDRDKTSLKY